MGRQPDAPGFLFPALATTDRTRREGLPSSTADGEEARWLRVTRPWAASLSGGCWGREQGWPCGQKPPGARPAPLCGEPGPSGHGLHGTRPGCPTWPCGPGPACTPHPPNARSSLGSSLRSAAAPAHGVKAEPPAPAASSRPPPLPPCLALRRASLSLPHPSGTAPAAAQPCSKSCWSSGARAQATSSRETSWSSRAEIESPLALQESSGAFAKPGQAPGTFRTWGTWEGLDQGPLMGGGHACRPGGPLGSAAACPHQAA